MSHQIILALPDYSNHLVVLAQLCFCLCAFSTLLVLRYWGPHQIRNTRAVIYGGCLFLCGLCSYLYTTRYAGLPTPLLRHFDHAAIFLLIAGTYTPFATEEILGPFQIRLLYWIWGIACIGIVLSLAPSGSYDRLFVILYMGMGWAFLTALDTVLRHIPHFSLWFLGSGAAVYTIGAIIFFLNLTVWTDTVWHCCVMTAAILHFVSILGYLMQKNSSRAQMNV